MGVLYDAVLTVEKTIQDAQKVIDRIDDDVHDLAQIRVELDGLWNVLKMIAATVEDRAEVS